MKDKSLFFIAVLLKEPCTSNILELQKTMCSKFAVCKSLNAPPHVTLIPPFWLLPDHKKYVLSMIKGYQLKQFKITTSDMAHFDDRVIFVDVVSSDELDLIRTDLLSSLRALDIQPRVREDFHPHITIGHKIRRKVFPKAWDYFKELRFSEDVDVFGPVLLIHNEGKWQIVHG